MPPASGCIPAGFVARTPRLQTLLCPVCVTGSELLEGPGKRDVRPKSRPDTAVGPWAGSLISEPIPQRQGSTQVGDPGSTSPRMAHGGIAAGTRWQGR